MTVGVQNATNSTNTSATGLEFQEFTTLLGSNIGEKALGSPEIAGLILLLVAGFVLYRSNASIDISAAVMMPIVFFLADYGYLPLGEGLIYVGLITAAAFLSFGIARRFK